ncbi:MAG: hypothetical protein PGN11_09785 [Quadrisphaera sp.]
MHFRRGPAPGQAALVRVPRWVGDRSDADDGASSVRGALGACGVLEGPLVRGDTPVDGAAQLRGSVVAAHRVEQVGGAQLRAGARGAGRGDVAQVEHQVLGGRCPQRPHPHHERAGGSGVRRGLDELLARGVEGLDVGAGGCGRVRGRCSPRPIGRGL